MQSQALRQNVSVSPQQSLEVVKTLLSASFGCIAYLRNLLPEDNFGDGRLTSGDRGPMTFDTTTQGASQDKRQVSGVKIKTVTRGFSTEADKLLNYLEHGVFDAIERQYLKSFIFAIYLDSDDPNNIIEAYTYNLSYHTIPGTTTTVPIMSLDDQLSGLSLTSKTKPYDPVAHATLQGKAPTLGDVKLSVKNLVKNLILTTQALEPLPRRRFATFKLFYREHTPTEYEPPYFRPGDPIKDKFIFTTHNKAEVPEKFSVGSVITPHHGIDVKVQSVARYIPNGEDDAQEFLGFRSFPKGQEIKLASQVKARSMQTDSLMKDAEERMVAWNAEDPRWTDEDAEGDPDPDYVNDSGIAIDVPLGIRKGDGTIIPKLRNGDVDMETSNNDAHYYGKPEVVPDRVGQLKTKYGNDTLESTQVLESTQIIESLNEPFETGISNHSKNIDTQLLKSVLCQSSKANAKSITEHDMLDLETQLVDSGISGQSDRHFDESGTSGLVNGLTRQASKADSALDQAKCACNLDDGDDLVFCESCRNWMHLWCMGYHSPTDSRLPENYVCIPCRLQSDINFHLIKDVYSDILSAYTDLAHFRRAIKIAEKNNPESLKDFRKVVKCEASLAEQLWKRLEREGFILLEITEIDKLGLSETRIKTTAANGKCNTTASTTKKVKGPRQIRKYVFAHSILKSARYKNYFTPDSEVEMTMLGLKKKDQTSKQRESERDNHDSGGTRNSRDRSKLKSKKAITARAKGKKGQSESKENQRPVLTGTRKSESGTGETDKKEEDGMEVESQTQEDSQYGYDFGMITSGPSELKRRVRDFSQDQQKEGTKRAGKKVKVSLGRKGLILKNNARELTNKHGDKLTG
ncbi:meiosis specific hop1 [Pyrrhoderma noxium]|uniref:Meiosis specific hop1 n=1 Tax=Pyrrhoderma noxium TaxID=2282107 RepID=A0A286UW58_9AGAM|nr:meiosis specific hop1 [Pyrrhoderma noxium]